MRFLWYLLMGKNYGAWKEPAHNFLHAVGWALTTIMSAPSTLSTAPLQPWICTSLWGILKGDGGQPRLALSLLPKSQSKLCTNISFPSINLLLPTSVPCQGISFPGCAPCLFQDQLPQVEVTSRDSQALAS